MSKIKEYYGYEEWPDPNTELTQLVRDRVDDEIRWTREREHKMESYDSDDFYDAQMEKVFWGKSPRYAPTQKHRMSVAMDKAISKPNDTDYKPDAVNPKHYQDIVPGMQYMQMMVYMLKGKSGVEAHLFGQVYKYLMRCGSKDEETQELKKAKWYLDALIKFKTEGEVI